MVGVPLGIQRELLPSLADRVPHLSRRLHHVLQCRPDLFRLAGFQTAVGVDPDAIGVQHGEDGLQLAGQLGGNPLQLVA